MLPRHAAQIRHTDDQSGSRRRRESFEFRLMFRFVQRATMRAFMCSALAGLVLHQLSGCSTPPAQQASVAPASPTPVVPQQASTDALQQPLSSLMLNSAAPADSYARRSDARELAWSLAAEYQLDPQWVWTALSEARQKESVAKLMMPPPAATGKNWALYRSRFVEPIRIKAGVSFWRQHATTLQRAEQLYGVPAHIIAGVLGVETIYGRQMGNFRVLDALTTLSLDFPKGRSDRSAFFRAELGQFLTLCHEQNVAPASVLGSYAGAIGLPQFMPSSIRKWGVDFDGDGKVDLRNSPVDAIGSVAHYLAEHGWRAEWPSYFDITPPEDTWALNKLLAPDIRPSFSAEDMQALGATLAEAALNHPGKLALVKLENGGATATLIAGTANFYAITRYNQSSYYALAVIKLGEAVKRDALR